MENSVPYILDETEHYAVIFKPPKMHSAPVGAKKNDTLLEWAIAHSSVFDLVHRLDFETHGLVLAAKTAESFEFFRALQNKGEFVKEYSAQCAVALCSEHRSVPVPGFPPAPVFADLEPSQGKPLVIESFFRPFGPGRKQVRPVTEDDTSSLKHKETAKDNGGYYRTEIININRNIFTARIKRGFRHQIRCHLCWAGFPILNDPLYGDSSVSGELALRAHALFFTDPRGRRREYRIESIKGE